MAEPSDQVLYNKSKEEVNKTYDKPSAYRSMAYTRTYLKNYREKYGDDKKAYKGTKEQAGELKTWRKEKWVDVKSVLQDPKNPIACGNAPIKKGEYPLCMPEKELVKYSKSELNLLVKRKNEIGKRRLVKDAYLRDVLEPEKITPIREYKDKYVKEPKNKLPEPLPKAQAEKILKEKPIKAEKPVKEKVVKPKVTRTAEELDAIRYAKNARQREAYVSVAKPRAAKAEVEQVAKPAKVDADGNPIKKTRAKISYSEPPPPFKVERVKEPVKVSFD
jgi:hypothetical protein